MKNKRFTIAIVLILTMLMMNVFVAVKDYFISDIELTTFFIRQSK